MKMPQCFDFIKIIIYDPFSVVGLAQPSLLYHAMTLIGKKRHIMDWTSVINNPFLKDLPFKIELDKWGRILMSPASNNHGYP